MPIPTTAAPIPQGRTAHRLTWEFLPPQLRTAIERRLGSRVVRAETCDSGFTPGFASVLTGLDGSRIFVKAANRTAQELAATAYAEEARKHHLLGTAIPAPQLLWAMDGDWVVLGFEAIEGGMPQRPWRPSELSRALDLAEEIAAATAEIPEGLDLEPLLEAIPPLRTGWQHVAHNRPEWPHLSEAAELAETFADVPADRFAHTDLRDDNILIGADGCALACDWNWPTLAPPWIDLVMLLVAAYGDGIAPEPLLADRALTRDVPREHIDAWLAAVCGYMLTAADLPVQRNSPFRSRHAAWYAEAAWNWLTERRGWV